MRVTISPENAPYGFVTKGFCESIGRTPLIRLRALSDATGSEILGKAEFLNPGGSVKDRAALGIVLDAEASGALEPGGTVVEGTAGYWLSFGWKCAGLSHRYHNSGDSIQGKD